uniref:Uncharacterized protein n=1 Tax=Xenopus tropicalis TaxID=8364 RepID=A0A6I8SAM5_XENTR
MPPQTPSGAIKVSVGGRGGTESQKWNLYRSAPTMVRPAATVGWWFLGFLLLLLPHPGTPWYKHSASPRYHTVGRASGLLIGVRRSPYLWRRQMTEDKVEENQQREVEGMKVTQGAERSNFLSDPRETPERWEKQLEQERSLEEVRRDLPPALAVLPLQHITSLGNTSRK